MRCKTRFLKLFFAFFLGFPLPLSSALQITLGPEIYHLQRIRQGKLVQSGCMEGVRFTFERVRDFGFYLALDALYAQGNVRGRNLADLPLKSELTDTIVEGRIGYMLRHPCTPTFMIPYLGCGYFHEENSFLPPSPIPFTFDDTFNYVAFGFLSGYNLTPLLSIGLNFETKFMFSGRSTVSDDPIYDEVSLIMNNEIQARVELPLIYTLYPTCSPLKAELTPFYEFRHFGGREAFPFDFIDTKFHLWGVRCALKYVF